jgi:hypothetical protein
MNRHDLDNRLQDAETSPGSESAAGNGPSIFA